MTSNYLRIALWTLLGLALLANYNAWMHDYGLQPTTLAESSAKASRAPGADIGLRIPRPSSSTAVTASTSSPESAGREASAAAPSGAISSPALESAAPGVGGGTAAAAAMVHVRTDVLDLAISLQGGTLVRADLLKYPQVKGRPEPVRLENADSAETLYLLQSGLSGPDDEPRPDHLASFTSSQGTYTLQPGAGELQVPLTWTDGHGVTVRKVFTFRPGSYEIGLQQIVQNHSDMPWQAAQYSEIQRNDRPTKSSMFNFNAERYAFHGPALYDGMKYRKLNISSSDDQHLSLDVRGGWLAAPQHHFVSAVVPPASVPYHYTLNVEGNTYALAAVGPSRTVAAGATESFDAKLFIGPKLQAQLEATAPELVLVADYGKLTILAKPLFWLLGKAHALLHNWGLAIIFVTFLLKLLFYPLSEASGRSMAKMKALAPRIKTIQENYKDDREKAGRAMMELYQREKVNPVAGCLPIIIQIPVFLAFYWVLLESVEMRQAPFFGWINDLSSRDPLFILPAIMAGAMFVQYKLNPAPPDPVQAKVMMIMPLAMSVMFAFFPAGLVLYWVTNTILSIAQQWNINRRIEASTKKKS